MVVCCFSVNARDVLGPKTFGDVDEDDDDNDNNGNDDVHPCCPTALSHTCDNPFKIKQYVCLSLAYMHSRFCSGEGTQHVLTKGPNFHACFPSIFFTSASLSLNKRKLL